MAVTKSARILVITVIIAYYMDRKDKVTKVKNSFQFDPLDVTESLGYKTYRKNGRNSWSKEDDNELRTLLNRALIDLGFPHGTDDIKSIQESESVCKRVAWEDIAALFKNSPRKPKELRKRWTSSLDPNLKRGKWASEEDDLLLKAYAKHGPHWLDVAGEISGRTEDQCAKRYVEILGPSSEGRLRKWTLEEDLSLVSKVKSYGTKWRRISSELESRPSLTCRNRWRKIITSVVRGQAPPEIVKAVKENQDIDSLVHSLRAKVKGKGKLKDGFVKSEDDGDERDKDGENDSPNMAKSSDSSSNDLPQTLGTHFADRAQISEHNNMTQEQETITNQPLSAELVRGSSRGIEKFENESSRLKQRQAPELDHNELILRGRSPASGHITRETTASYDPMSKTSLDEKQTMATVKGLTPFAERMNLSPHLDRGSATNLDGSSLPSNVYSRESAIRLTQNVPIGRRVSEANFNPSSSTPQDAQKASLESSGQTEWKFTLKDSQGLSITSGSISNSDLVKELIEQAKKFSLKISLHQHIHHHYGGQTDQNCINPNSSEPVADFRSGQVAGPAIGPPSAGHDFFTSSHYYRASMGNNSDFFSQEANYNIFGLEPSPQPEASHLQNNVPFPHSNPLVHQNHSPVGYPSRPETTSPTASHSTGNNDDIPDITSHRVSHFNYLPATVRPQLESSDSTRSTDITRLLNPSPNPGKKKRKRRRSLQSETSLNSGHRTSVRVSPSSSTSKQNKPLDATTLAGALHEEEGPDFWESLRSLAGKPQEEEEKSYSYHPYDDEDYDILYSLFDEKAESIGLDTAKEKAGGDKDNIIPFNPS